MKYAPNTATKAIMFALALTLCNLVSAQQAGAQGKCSQPADQKETPLDIRIKRDTRESLSLLTHKQNYFLPFVYNISNNNRPAEAFDDEIEPVEVKFQLSVKTMVLKEIFKDSRWPEFLKNNGYLFFGYTQQSFWQLYAESAPFRESNYEPEAMLTFYSKKDFLGLKNRINTIGFVHQSNGLGGATSRSWNRLYASTTFEKGNFDIELKPWLRISEDAKDDNNPRIEQYLGHGELTLRYYLYKTQFGLIFRNNLRSDNRGSIQFDYSIPLPGVENLALELQFFNGYGESLIDYDHSITRFGIGFTIVDWL